MKLFVKYLLLFFAVGMIGTLSAWSETVYVSGVMKITMRTGPAVDHKIVTMLQSGDALERIEESGGWSRVKTTSGKEGWVLTRFITADMPRILLVNRLKEKNLALSKNLERVKAENSRLLKERTELKAVEKSYLRLKKQSADLLTLEQKYKEATGQFKAQQERIAALEKNLESQDIKWFLSGAGVLIAGMLLGISARKKKHSSLL